MSSLTWEVYKKIKFKTMSLLYFKKNVLITCPICGKEFKKRSNKHIYCDRECFKLAYLKKGKISIYPFFICPKCGKKEMLTFFPNKDYRGWKNFKCGDCGFSPIG